MQKLSWFTEDGAHSLYNCEILGLDKVVHYDPPLYEQSCRTVAGHLPSACMTLPLSLSGHDHQVVNNC